MVNKSAFRKDIIKVASKIFSTNGYNKTTMNDIAKAMKKGKSSIYYYFGSKEDIFRAVVLEEGKQYRNAIIHDINTQKSPVQKLVQYMLTRMETLCTLVNFHAAINSEKPVQLDFIIRLRKIYRNEEIRLFQNILQEGVEKKYFRITNIKMAAEGIINAFRGVESAFKACPNPKERRTRTLEVLNIICHGILKRPVISEAERA